MSGTSQKNKPSNSVQEIKPPASSLSRLEDDAKLSKSKLLDKSFNENNLQGMMSANGNLPDAVGADKNQDDIRNGEQKNKLWMDFDDFFVCFKYLKKIKNF